MVIRRTVTSCALVLVLGAGALAGVSGCSLPPAITKAELDAKKTPAKHPKLTEKQRQNCRGCHREAPAIRQ